MVINTERDLSMRAETELTVSQDLLTDQRCPNRPRFRISVSLDRRRPSLQKVQVSFMRRSAWQLVGNRNASESLTTLNPASDGEVRRTDARTSHVSP